MYACYAYVCLVCCKYGKFSLFRKFLRKTFLYLKYLSYLCTWKRCFVLSFGLSQICFEFVTFQTCICDSLLWCLRSFSLCAHFLGFCFHNFVRVHLNLGGNVSRRVLSSGRVLRGYCEPLHASWGGGCKRLPFLFVCFRAFLHLFTRFLSFACIIARK